MTLRSLFTAGALVAMGMLSSRLLGLLREMLLASRFGVGSQADLAIALLIIPDFITGALIGNAASATLVPLFTARGREQGLQLFWQVLIVSLSLFLVIVALIDVNETRILPLIVKDASMVPMASAAFLVALAAIPLTAATAVTIAWLQYSGKFVVPAFANAIFNGVIVLMLWLMPTGVTMVAIAILLAACARFAAHALAFYRSGGRLPAAVWRPWLLHKTMAKTYAATMMTDIFNLFPQFAPYYVISATGAGLALFNYAFRLAVVPAMIGYSVTQMVLLPWFARIVQNSVQSTDKKEGDEPYLLTLQCAWALSLAICLSLSLASHEAAQLCFGYGKMNESDIDGISRLFIVGLWAMPGILLAGIWQQILYAHGRPRMPLIASFMQAVAIVPLSWFGLTMSGLQGVMLAYAAIQTISVAVMAYGGFRLGIIAHFRPSAMYIKMLAVALMLWVPLAWAYGLIAAPALIKILLAMAIGAIILVASLAVCHPVRQWMLTKLKPR